MKSKFDYAEQYASDGIDVFPCDANGKSPLTKHGYKDASSNANDVERWWKAYPDANIGMPTGRRNNLVIVDVDIKGGAKGFESLSQLMSEGVVFDTKTVKTPSGGYHYYYTYPEGFDRVKNKVNVRPGIDIRADGGYVVAPGSSIDGNNYEFPDNNKEISELPEKLLKVITGESELKTSALSKSSILSGVIEQGGRNDGVFKIASKLRGDDVPLDVAKAEVLATASACNPPLPHSEAIRCLESAYSHYQPNPKNPTDTGNAKRLVNLFGDDIRYVYEFKKWIHWDGNRWLFDEDGHIFRLAKKTARSIATEAANESNDNSRSKLLKHAISSEHQQRLLAMVDVAKSEPNITISQSTLDQDKYLLGTKNGVVNLKTGGLLDNAKDKMLTKQIGVAYDPDAECPRWIQFIDEITGGDKELSIYLKRIVGYSLTGDTKEQILFFLFGGGANGKSVFVNTIQTLLCDYAMQTPVSTIMTRGKGGINNDVARLRGSRLVATTETEEGSRFNESEIKLLTGGDIITARFLHQEYFQFLPQFKLWISGNHKPVPGEGYGFWRRLILIPFNVRFSGDQKDKYLEGKLKAEASGVLNWAIEGCLEWQDKGLQTPGVILDATKEYKSEMDRINSWMEECCVEHPSPSRSEKATDLYQSYREWAKNNGEWEMTQRIFGTKLVDRGLSKKRDSRGYSYLGIQLVERPF